MAKGRLLHLLILVLALVAATGCSKHPSMLAPNQKAAAPSQLPFDLVSDNKGRSPTSQLESAEVAAGTPIVIRLRSSLSSAGSHSGDTFEAELDQSIIVEGRTVAPRGLHITGRVVSAKAAGGFNDPGYLRLTLSSISVAGDSLPLQTSSIFAKGGRNEAHHVLASTGSPSPETPDGETSNTRTNHESRFSTGRQLTFRLAKSLLLHS
jgi:hypothetical protein